jgi:hypothetical protein
MKNLFLPALLCGGLASLPTPATAGGDPSAAWQVCGSWQKHQQNGTLLGADGRTRVSLQQAINQAMTGAGSPGRDLSIKGADATAGGAAVINNTRTVVFPVSQGKRVEIGAVTIRGDAALGPAPVLAFDSQEMLDFALDGGQITYHGTGAPVLFAPQDPTQLDRVDGIVDSTFKFTTTGPVDFHWRKGAPSFAEANYFNFGELNYSNAWNGTSNHADFYVPTVAPGQNFGYNIFQSQHVHGDIGTGTLWKIGNGVPPAGQDFGDNIYALNLLPDASPDAVGIDTYERNSTYIANIGRITAGTPLRLERGACGNIFILAEDSHWAGNVDASGCSDNLILGNGRYGFGLSDYISSPAPGELALTTHGVPAMSIKSNQQVGFTAGYGYRNMLSSAAAPAILSGFGAGASVVSGNGTATFRVDVGDGGTADAGVLRMPGAANGWNCQLGVVDPSPKNLLSQSVLTASTATSVAIRNELTSSGAPTPWPAHTVLMAICAAY